MVYKKILLLDDDPDDAEIFMRAVDSLNRRALLHWTSSLQNAIDKITSAEDQPDFIFINYKSTFISILELLERLEKERKFKVPIVLIISGCEKFVDQLLADNKIAAILTKPFIYQQLIYSLNRIFTI